MKRGIDDDFRSKMINKITCLCLKEKRLSKKKLREKETRVSIIR